MVKKLAAGILVGLLCGLLAWLLSEVFFRNFFYRIEAQTYDWRLRLATEHPQNPIEDIIIVDVDTYSIKQLGSYHHWPRSYWAQLIRYLADSGVIMVGIDFIFDPDFRNEAEDQEFQQALQEAGMVCGAIYFSQADTLRFLREMTSEPEGLQYQRLIYNLPENLFRNLIPQERLEPEYPGFTNACYTAGYVNLFPDPDGVLRRIPLFLRFNQHAYASFAVQMGLTLLDIREFEYRPQSSRLLLKNGEGQQMAVPVDEYGQMLIHYEGGFNAFRYVSFYQILKKQLPPEYLKNKIVLVGSSLPGLFDLRTSPLQAAYPGVEVNANVLYQLATGQFVKQFSDTFKIVFLLLMGLLAGVILIFPRPLGSIILTVLLLFLVMFAGLYLMEHYRLWLPLATPMFTIILVFAVTYVYRYVFEERNKRFIRQVFSHYMSSSVVDVLLENPEMIKLGGEKKFCTVLFSDVAGFTSLSEKLPPDQLVTLLNEYLTEMTNIIFHNKGMLDKYEGDAIMAVFGAPMELKDHAALACKAALQMQKRLEILRERWKNSGRPELYARIGINSGEMVVGNMGSETRFDYTVMGDSVNLASRLEGANKFYSTAIMIGERTHKLVADQFVLRPLDLLRVKGREEPVKVYELLGEKTDSLSSERQELLSVFQKGFDAYLARDWETGCTQFSKVLEIDKTDGPARLYLQRCQAYREDPPDDDWDGVYAMKSK